MDNYVKVIVVATHVRAKSQYDETHIRRYPDDSTASLSPTPATLEGKGVRVTLVNSNADPDLVTLLAPVSGPDNRQFVADGGYLVISDDGTTGLNNGRIYRLGNRRTDQGQWVWELFPGNDMASSAEDVTNAYAFIIGRSAEDPVIAPSLTLGGNEQDVGVYVTFLSLQ